MPLTFHSIRSGPAESPKQVVESCPLRRVLVTLRFRNANARNKPALKAQQVTIAIGDQTPETVDTDDNGDVTLEYRGDGALSQAAARATWTANRRVGEFKLSSATRQRAGGKVDIYFLAVDVAGTFTLQVDIRATRPWDSQGNANDHHMGLPGMKGMLRWTATSGTAQTAPVTCDIGRTPYFTKNDLPCGTEITVEGLLPGAIGGAVVVKIDGAAQWLAAGDQDVNSGSVTYRRAPHDKSFRAVINVDRHGTIVHVNIRHRFPKVMIVGEGTYFDYAVGLAEKYNSAQSGVVWVYASQYDVTPVAQLPTNYAGKNPTTGNGAPYNQLARVQASCNKNLLILPGPGTDDNNNPGRFDATDQAHWQHVKDTYGDFDAVIFNNPHPGYGLHECVVFGLKSAERALDKGRYISVHTVGYDVPPRATISDEDWTLLLKKISGKRFDVQQPVVRDELQYDNTPTTTVLAFTAAGVAEHVPIHQAFCYANNDAIDAEPPDHPAYYGGDNEFADHATNHYKCIVTRLGLHPHVMRGYRRYAPSVLVSGGELFIHGAAIYEQDLTSAVKNGNAVLASAMEHGISWRSNPRFFLWYPTNFTSSRFHPSHFTSRYNELHEPSLNNAMMYRWVKP